MKGGWYDFTRASPYARRRGSRAARASRRVGRGTDTGAVRPRRRRVDPGAGAVGRRRRVAGARRAGLERDPGPRGGRTPGSRRWRADAITTVVPSTTATALTSISTGLAPAQHGVVGYRMLVDAGVLNVLRWTVAGRGRAPDPFDVQRHAPFLGREVPVVTRAEFRDTGFTQAHLRGARIDGWHTVAGLVEQCVRAVAAGEKLRVRVLPGRRHDRARVRAARPRVRTRARVRRSLRRRAARRAAARRRAARHVRSRPDAPRSRSRGSRSPISLPLDRRDGGRRPLPLPLREPDTAARSCSAGRASCSRTGPGCGRGAEVLEIGHVRDGRDRHRARAHRQRRARGAASRWRSSIRRCPTSARCKSGHGSLTPDEMYVPLLAARGAG